MDLLFGIAHPAKPRRGSEARVDAGRPGGIPAPRRAKDLRRDMAPGSGATG